MKTKSLLIAAWMLSGIVASQSQTINPGSEWRVDFVQADPGYMKNTHYRDFIDGDTIINSTEYYKIYKSGYTYTEEWGIGYYTYFSHALHGYLRENGMKWYTRYNYQDALLFDFTLNVNDTVHSAYTQIFDYTIWISAIDSIMVGNEIRKRFYLDSDYELIPDYIIEGIGASSGLFQNMIFFEWYSELICYAQNGVSQWGQSTEDCDLNVKIDEHAGDLSTISLCPNPASGWVVVSFAKDMGFVDIKLIDMLGEIVYRDNMDSNSINRIQLSAFRPGVYFAVFENQSVRQTVKLVIK